MTLGNTIILVAAILIYFGFGRHLLDRMKLSDRMALVLLAALVLGSFIDLQIADRPLLLLNLGGAVVPLVYSGYLVATAGTRREKIRAVASALATGLVAYSVGTILPDEPSHFWSLEPTYLFAIVGALTAYLLGRSSRAAFVAASSGAVLADLARFSTAYLAGAYRGRIWIGGTGVFDTVVISGLMALLLVELAAETGPAAAPLKDEGAK